MTDINTSEVLRNVATIVTLRTHAWGAQAKDDDAVATVAHANNATQVNIGRFNKKLLAGADTEYKTLVAKIREAKSGHQKMTLPYIKGQALLPNQLIFEYTQMMGDYKVEIRQLKADFKQAYPAAMQTAMGVLGGLADASKYPPAASIVVAFGIDVECLPIPDGISFAHLPAAFSEALANQLNTRMKTRVDEAMRTGWSELDNKLAHLSAVMGNPDTKRLRATLITNVDVAAKTLKLFEALYASEHSDIITDVQGRITCYDMSRVKHSESLKVMVVDATEEILRKMRDASLVETEVATVATGGTDGNSEAVQSGTGESAAGGTPAERPAETEAPYEETEVSEEVSVGEDVDGDLPPQHLEQETAGGVGDVNTAAPKVRQEESDGLPAPAEESKEVSIADRLREAGLLDDE